MAKPIKLGLALEDEDTSRFEKYLADPDNITPEGRELHKKAAKISKQRRKRS